MFALEEEHGHKVALVLVNDHNIGTFCHLELNKNFIWDLNCLFLDLDLFFCLGLSMLGSVIFPHFPNIQKFLGHLISQLLHHVDVIEGDLRLQW